MNKEGCLTFGGCSLVDEVNHVPRVSFVLSPLVNLLPSLCIVSKCFVSFILFSYDHVGQIDCSTPKEKGAKNVLLSYCSIVCMLSHSQVIMMLQYLWMWVIPSGISIKVYVGENCRTNVFTMQGFWHFRFNGETCLIVSAM